MDDDYFNLMDYLLQHTILITIAITITVTITVLHQVLPILLRLEGCHHLQKATKDVQPITSLL